MPVVNPKIESFGARHLLINLDGGLMTKYPLEDIPDSASPRLANVIYDHKFCLSKIWGTTLLGETNGFFTPPIFNLYRYNTLSGDEILIIQAIKNNKMGIYKMHIGDITPTLIIDSLANYRRCSFTTYKGRLYWTNGADPLTYWDGGNTIRKYHTDKTERFHFLLAFNNRLWAARSAANPCRLICSEINYCNFYHYYHNEAGYFDFMGNGKDYSPITGFCAYRDGIIVFKLNSIFWFNGNPDAPEFRCLAHGVGCINDGTIVVWNDKVYFVWFDGIYILGDEGVITDEERKLQVRSGLTRVTSEIDDFWQECIGIYNPVECKQKIWSGEDMNNFVLTKMVYTEPPVSNNPKVLIAEKVFPGSPIGNSNFPTHYVNLTGDYGVDQYYGQSAKAIGAGPIPYCLALFLKSVGTITPEHSIDVLICGEDSNGEPDLTKLYAEGSLTGNDMVGVYELSFDTATALPRVNDVIEGGTSGARGRVHRVVQYSGSLATGTGAGIIYIKNKTGVWQDNETINIVGGANNIALTNTDGGDARSLSNGCWMIVNFTYHDYPQNLFNGLNIPPTFFIIVKPHNMTPSNYLQWGYNPVGTVYPDGRMYNSDANTPPNQEDCDYCFRLFTAYFPATDIQFVIPPTFVANDLLYWDKLYVMMNTDTFGGYTRNMKLEKLEYAILSDPYATPVWQEIINGGKINATYTDGLYITIRATFKNPGGMTKIKNDSVTIMGVRVSYLTDHIEKFLMSSAVYENRYYLSVEQIIDYEQLPI